MRHPQESQACHDGLYHAREHRHAQQANHARERVQAEDAGTTKQRVAWWSVLALLRALASSPVAASATLRKRAANVTALTAEEADELGRESDAPVDGWIDVGALDGDGNPLFVEKRRIVRESTTFVFVVDRKPARAGIDPFNKLIDRKPKDNTMPVTIAPPG